jgi:glycosyltransferase involved in cell wall biosynthesis
MDISVAICTWNRARLLRQTLERLAEVSPGWQVRWRLILIDNNSSDDTAAVAGAFAGRLPMTTVVERRQGLSHARNRALSEATGSHLVFTDDDVLVSADWLDAFAAGVRAYPEAAVFGGPIEPWFEAPPDPDLARAFPMLAMGFCGIAETRPAGPLPAPKEVFGANMAFRLGAIEHLTFDPELGASAITGLGGDEVEFVRRIRSTGGEVVWLPDMRVRHYVDPVRTRLPYLRAYYEGRGRTVIREDGLPPGRSVAGVPLWLVRQWAGHAVDVVRHGVLGRRLDYLTSVRHERYHRGMIKECARQARDRKSPLPARP